jgi:hypothetical protein
LQETGNATGFFTPARAVDPRSGTRSSALTGYFEPNADRKNLVVLTGAEATKVLFKSAGTQSKKTPRVAEAVEFVSGGHKYTVKAKREIILSAGVPPPSLPGIHQIGRVLTRLQARLKHLSFWSCPGSVIEACSKASASKPKLTCPALGRTYLTRPTL